MSNPSAPQAQAQAQAQALTQPQPANPGASADAALEREVAALIVAALNLEVTPEEIGSDAPLYGEGLGLDSIDMLEVALVVSKQYGFQMRANDESNVAIFGSLKSLADHIAAHRTT